MRLVEVVVLMGAHCISPVAHTQTTTEAAKVQCAVVIEKDTDQGTIKVNPEAAAQDPKVAEAVARFKASPAGAQADGGTKIVPAFAPAGTPATTTAPAAQPKPFGIAAPPPPPSPPSESTASADASSTDGDQPAAEQTAEASPDAAATPDDASASTDDTADAPAPTTVKKKHAAKTAKPKAEPQASAKSEPKTAAAKGGQCSGSATPKWYTTSDGHKKYRCVRTSDAGTAAVSPAADPQPAGSESTRPAAPARPSLFGTYLQSKKVY